MVFPGVLVAVEVGNSTVAAGAVGALHMNAGVLVVQTLAEYSLHQQYHQTVVDLVVMVAAGERDHSWAQILV